MAGDSAERSAAAHQRPDQWRGFRERPLLHVLDRERSRLDRRHRISVAVTAIGEKAPGSLEAILPASQAWVPRADVLDEEQPATRPEHASGLGQGSSGIGNRAENECEDGGVEAVVGKGQLLGWRLDDLDSRL